MTAPPITLRSPAELLAVIPHVLGFEPEHAIVVLALRDNKLGLTQRMDLPQPDRTTEVANTLARHVLRDEAEAVLLVGYEDTRGESLPVIEALSQRLRSDGVTIRDRLVVYDCRWRSLDCDRPTCCPPCRGKPSRPSGLTGSGQVTSHETSPRLRESGEISQLTVVGLPGWDGRSSSDHCWMTVGQKTSGQPSEPLGSDDILATTGRPGGEA